MNKENLWLILTILFGFLLLAGVIMFGAKQGWFKINVDVETDGTTIGLLNNPDGFGYPPSSNKCQLYLDKNTMYSGQTVVGDIKDGANNLCWVYAFDGTEWKLVWQGYTDGQGLISEAHTIDLVGTFTFRAICDMNDNLMIDIKDCITNSEVLEIKDSADNPNPEEDCEWVEIDKYTGDVPSASTMEWGLNFVEGKFKFTWDYNAQMTTDVLKSSVSQYSVTNQNGGYTFDSVQNEHWGLEVMNPYRSNIDTTLRLFQWICEGDPQNWNADFFGTGHMKEEMTDEECYTYCEVEGLSIGGYYTGNQDDCEEQNNIYVESNGCCCYSLII